MDWWSSRTSDQGWAVMPEWNQSDRPSYVSNKRNANKWMEKTSTLDFSINFFFTFHFGTKTVRVGGVPEWRLVLLLSLHHILLSKYIEAVWIRWCYFITLNMVSVFAAAVQNPTLSLCPPNISCLISAECRDLSSNLHFMASLNTHFELKCHLENIKPLLILNGSEN